jgi:hypothetical protein
VGSTVKHLTNHGQLITYGWAARLKLLSIYTFILLSIYIHSLIHWCCVGKRKRHPDKGGSRLRLGLNTTLRIESLGSPSGTKVYYFVGGRLEHSSPLLFQHAAGFCVTNSFFSVVALFGTVSSSIFHPLIPSCSSLCTACPLVGCCLSPPLFSPSFTVSILR